MNSNPSDSVEAESVVESVRRGDRQVLESLLSNHRSYLRQVIDLRLDDALRIRVDASDIVQEAQMEAIRRVDDYARNPKLPVRLWMRQIAIDRLAMARRRYIGAEKRTLRRQLVLPDDSTMSLAEQLVARFSSPSVNVTRDEMIRMVRNAVSQLADKDREIVLLHAFEGLTSSDSAQVLGIEAATARKRYGRALLRLRQSLIESGLGDSQL